MAWTDKIGLAAQLLRTVLTWRRRDLDARPPGLANAKFRSAREAIARVPDGAVVMTSGMGANLRPAILYFAFGDAFAVTGHPRGLTWISAGAAGGRGRVPGTVEELARPGQCVRYISGHLETARALLRAGAAGAVELHALPQGQLCLALEAQGRGEASITSEVGVGTFVDPRVGAGSRVTPGAGASLSAAEGGQLRYTLPPVTCAAVLATQADEDGNIYMRDASIHTEVREAVRAARRNGGLAIVTVAGLIPRSDPEIFLRADEVDAIVVCPANEQTLTVPQRRPWRMFLPGAREDVAEAMARMGFVNRMLRLDPVRGPLERALARLAAQQLTRLAAPGAHVIYGYGLPQEVGHVLEAAGLAGDVTCLIETGVYGGVPAPGLFFGTAVNPERISSSAELFRYCRTHLDVTLLGLLQVDSDGNVNVSRKGTAVEGYVGPGGFIDLVSSARTIIFLGQFQERAKVSIRDGRLRVDAPGRPKFVAKVGEVTFNGREALRRGQTVRFVTTVGIFRLTEGGLELEAVMPGIDIGRDILGGSGARIRVPEAVPVVDGGCLAGGAFPLAWGDS